MDFSWTDEQLALKQRMVEFAQQELNPDWVAADKNSVFSRDLWQKCAAFGIQGLALPTQYGGGGDVDIMTALLAMEGLGYGCRDNGLPFALNAQMWTVQWPILNFGSEAQKTKYLPSMCRGTAIGAHGITEPEAGSDVFSLQTHAERRGETYVLNGRKKYVSLAPVADIALIFATINPAVGHWGVTAFIVEKDMPGFHVDPMPDKMGLRTVPMGGLRFEDCVVPETNRLGPEGAGVSMSNHSLEWERCCILASQLGAMARQLDTSIHYARERVQFGQPIGKFQSVSNRIANMKLRLETSRLLLYQTAWLKKTGISAPMETALCKLHLSECFAESSLDAIRIHGGHGYLAESEVERDLRDAVGGVIYGGTSDIQRNVIARLLGV